MAVGELTAFQRLFARLLQVRLGNRICVDPMRDHRRPDIFAASHRHRIENLQIRHVSTQGK